MCSEAGSARVHGVSRRTAKDWFEYLGLDSYCCTFVRDVDERESLSRMGIHPECIRSIQHYRDIMPRSEFQRSTKCVVTSQVDDWTLLIERNSAEGLVNSHSLSRGTEVVTAYLGLGTERSFRYVRDGKLLTAFEDGELGHLAGWGESPELLAPFVARVGPRKFRDFDDDGMTPDLELACLVAGVQPQPEDFHGPLLCADLPRRMPGPGNSFRPNDHFSTDWL